MIGRGILLAYPDFNDPFEINTDASKKIGTVIYQKGSPIAFCSRKTNNSQQDYTKTDKELLSTVASIKEFRNILLRHQITVYTELCVH